MKNPIKENGTDTITQDQDKFPRSFRYEGIGFFLFSSEGATGLYFAKRQRGQAFKALAVTVADASAMFSLRRDPVEPPTEAEGHPATAAVSAIIEGTITRTDADWANSNDPRSLGRPIGGRGGS
jgi:hypothetical protein